MRKATIVAMVAGILAALLFAIPAVAVQGDANRDRIPDRWEKRHGLSLRVNQAPRDQDQDGLRNLREFREGTDPRNADSDADGESDREECRGDRPPPPSTDGQPPAAP
jgi:hypothetical protein